MLVVNLSVVVVLDFEALANPLCDVVRRHPRVEPFRLKARTKILEPFRPRLPVSQLDDAQEWLMQVYVARTIPRNDLVCAVRGFFECGRQIWQNRAEGDESRLAAFMVSCLGGVDQNPPFDR